MAVSARMTASRSLGHRQRMLDVLRRHCDLLGRDFATIEKTVTSSFDLGEDPARGTRDRAEDDVTSTIVPGQ